MADTARIHDDLDALAGRLWDAYYLDTRDPEPWPPPSQARYRAWRRVAALALDLGATA